MSRSAIDQGLVTGGSIIAGFTAGAVGSLTLDGLPRPIGGLIVRSAGVGVAGARASAVFGGQSPMAPVGNSTVVGWTDAGLDVLGGIALSRLLTSERGVLPRAVGLAGFGASMAEGTVESLSARSDDPDPRYLAISAAVGVGGALGVGAALGVVRLGGVALRSLGRGRTTRATLSIVGSAAVAAAGAFAAGKALERVVGKIARGNRATEIAYAEAPTSTFVTGGAGSKIPFGSLGLQGRRFVSSVTTADSIAAVTGRPAVDPIRIYVGVESGDTDDERVLFALEELRRCRAFERSILVAACPAGTGYVNFIAAETVEYMTGGDCAVVAVQYGSLPSMLSLDKVPIASATYRKLLVACREEIDLTGSPTRLVAYGESLGALAGESGLRTATDDGTLVTDRALWVGTPVGSLLFDRLVADGTPVFDSPADLDGREAGAITFLNHDNDPVTKFEPAIAYRMPGWMEPKDRGRGTDPAQRWIPGVAFFQGLIDTKNAATVVPGEFKSSGHDYRADLASMIRFAYDLDVDETTMTAIEDALRRSEVERSTSIALGRLGTG